MLATQEELYPECHRVRDQISGRNETLYLELRINIYVDMTFICVYDNMDTRFFGPSAWQLFHLIAAKSPDPKVLFLQIKDILPCKYCRESTKQFTKELPYTGDAERWMYDLHNKVNHKLRKQSLQDPSVIAPVDSPSFEEVQKKYRTMKPSNIPGRDFLFAIAANYPEHPEESDIHIQNQFLHSLASFYPFHPEIFTQYIQTNPPALTTRKSYMKWMYGLLESLTNAFQVEIPTYKGYVQRIMYYKSGCNKKTYRGKTCRRLDGGGRTKMRDTAKTYRISHMSLLF